MPTDFGGGSPHPRRCCGRGGTPLKLFPLSSLPDLYESLTTPLARETQERIDALWERERIKGAALVDRQVLSRIECRDSRWVCAFVPYRHLVAQRRSEPLGAMLRVEPVSVSALLCCRDGLVLGRRSEHLHRDPGAWEWAPSGGIDPRARVGARRVSAQAQLFLELEEELGVRGIDVRLMRPFAIAESAVQRSHDLVFEVEVSLSYARLRAAWAALGRGEYSELRCIPIENLESALQELEPELSERGRRLLAAHDWIAGPGFNEGEIESLRAGATSSSPDSASSRLPEESSARAPR